MNVVAQHDLAHLRLLLKRSHLRGISFQRLSHPDVLLGVRASDVVFPSGYHRGRSGRGSGWTIVLPQRTFWNATGSLAVPSSFSAYGVSAIRRRPKLLRGVYRQQIESLPFWRSASHRAPTGHCKGTEWHTSIRGRQTGTGQSSMAICLQLRSGLQARPRVTPCSDQYSSEPLHSASAADRN